MRKITKGNAPNSFTEWVRKKPKDKDENQWFKALYENKEWGIISDLSHHNAHEQYYLCAYCCDRISGEPGDSGDTINEHVEARSIAKNRSLDHTNIVASCKKQNQCDKAHEDQYLPLTPLMDECETELKFNLSGRVEGLTSRATTTIQVLNLGDSERNNKALIEKRKQLSHHLLSANGINPLDGLEDEDLLVMVINDLLTPKDDKLEPFAPAVANILRNWIAA